MVQHKSKHQYVENQSQPSSFPDSHSRCVPIEDARKVWGSYYEVCYSLSNNKCNQALHSNQLATLVRILEPSGSTKLNFARWLCEEMMVCGVR